MTPQELKNSILQLAVQGKLVEQRPEEGTGEELYRQIQTEKQALIKAGKIKKEKHLPKIVVDEKPFDIPESWMWVRIGEAFCIEMGQSPDGNSVSESETGIEFHQGKVFFGKRYLEVSHQKTCAPTKIAEPNSVLLCVRAPVGKVNITTRRICIGRGLCSVMPLADMRVDFVYYLLATYENTFIRKATGTTFVAITGEVVKNQPIPLPPLAEQKRIVAKIEELLPLIERYEKAWSRLEDFNKRFPVDMQKSILQMGIQGKLVEQRPEEGTGEELYKQIQTEKQALIKAGKIKKEKPLPEITEDEIPFEIPESWKWVRLGNAISLLSGTDFKPEEYNDHAKGIPYITGASSLSETGVLVNRWTETPRVIAENGDVLLVCKGSGYGKTVICDIDQAHIARQIMAIKKLNSINMQYVMMFLKANLQQIKANGQGVIPGIDRGSVLSMCFPLPPIAEQKRIVARLEERLPLCERLK